MSVVHRCTLSMILVIGLFLFAGASHVDAAEEGPAATGETAAAAEEGADAGNGRPGTLGAATRHASASGSDSRDRGKDDRSSAAIPGAFVAVIFGVFGLLVIARRNPR